MKIRHISLIALLLLTISCNSGENITKTLNGGRPHNKNSSQYSSVVFEYKPAPGQFINGELLGFTGDKAAIGVPVDSPERAVEYAQARLANGSEVSLGGFGGYIVVGFDHTVQSWGSDGGGYDFSITSNQFKGSSEPGIVWVKQDLNGNGKPDEEEPWYELKGSEYGNDARDYWVTYFRPEGAGEDIKWEDSTGAKGVIARNSTHKQDSYYPLWLNDTESYRLTGTSLPRRDSVLEDGKYTTGDYGWGYADNFGADCRGMKNLFKISNAIDKNGNKVDIKYIDFIMVQTGLNIQGGGEAGSTTIGEISTEVSRFTDENLNK